jgi:hypothetical protein
MPGLSKCLVSRLGGFNGIRLVLLASPPAEKALATLAGCDARGFFSRLCRSNGPRSFAPRYRRSHKPRLFLRSSLALAVLFAHCSRLTAFPARSFGAFASLSNPPFALVLCGRPTSRPHGKRDLRSRPAYVVSLHERASPFHSSRLRYGRPHPSPADSLGRSTHSLIPRTDATARPSRCSGTCVSARRVDLMVANNRFDSSHSHSNSGRSSDSSTLSTFCVAVRGSSSTNTTRRGFL